MSRQNFQDRKKIGRLRVTLQSVTIETVNIETQDLQLCQTWYVHVHTLLEIKNFGLTKSIIDPCPAESGYILFRIDQDQQKPSDPDLQFFSSTRILQIY